MASQTTLVYCGVNCVGPPQITLQEQLLQISVAVSTDMLVLDCPYLANPATAEVQWSKEAQDITLRDENGKYEIFPNGSLQILRIALSDNQEYTCLVTNELGTDEATYTLLVIGEDIACLPTYLPVSFMHDIASVTNANKK